MKGVKIGQIGGEAAQAAIDGLFSRNVEFGRVGIDMAPELAASLYAPRIEGLFAEEGFGDIEVTVERQRIEFLAVNRHGSSVMLALRVGDALDLEIEAVSGNSVASGENVDLDWYFEGGAMKFEDPSEIRYFARQFSNW